MAFSLHILGRLCDSACFASFVAAVSRTLAEPGLRGAATSFENLIFKAIGYAFSWMLATPEDNLHTYRLHLSVRRRLRRLPIAKKRSVEANKDLSSLRIGMVGEMSCGGARPTTLITDFPAEHTFYAFDTGWNGQFNDVPHADNVHLIRHDLSTSGEPGLRALADTINAARLDVIIVANYDDGLKDDLVTLLTTPCIVNFIMGEWPLGNARVDYTLYPILRRELRFCGSKLYSEITRRIDPTERVYLEESHCYEKYNVALPAKPPLQQRERLMIFHGNLEKLYSKRHLDLIAELLAEDSELHFVYMGRGGCQPSIAEHFAKRGVANQVTFHGHIDRSALGAEGYIAELFTLLTRCRLAPSPWPQGGGLARIEAYLAGIPTVHMQLCREGKLWDRGDMPLTDVPCLEVPSTTARSISHYKQLCKQCLYDDAFAQVVVEEQYAIARRVTDTKLWWADIIDSYKHWVRGTGWAQDEERLTGSRHREGTE